MSNAKKLAYALIDALNACGIEEEFSYRFLAEMNDILRKENEKLEMNNEAQALAGNNKELQDGIIMLMKEYGLTAIDALQLLEKLSYKPALPIFDFNNVSTIWDDVKASAPIDKAVQESGTCEEPGDIADVMQDVYTSRNITGVYDEDNKPAVVPVSEYDYKSEIEALANISKGLCDGSIEHLHYKPEDNNNSEAHDEIVNALIKLSGVGTTKEDLEALRMKIYGTYADPVVFSSGEDPGDTHEPSKGSEKYDYESILKDLHTYLEYDNRELYNLVIGIVKEHQEQNKPVEYGTPKDIGNGEYAAEINPVPKYKPEPLSMYADGQTPKLFDVEHEGRAYQEMQFKDFAITFIEGDKIIKSTDIHEALQYVYLLCEGYMAHIDKRRYRMKEILMKQYPSHEVIVKVEEVKRYE